MIRKSSIILDIKYTYDKIIGRSQLYAGKSSILGLEDSKYKADKK